MDHASELEEARTLVARGEDEAAQAIYNDLINRGCRSFDMLIEAGVLAWSRGDRSNALVAFSMAVQLNPADKTGHVHLANLLTDDGAWSLDESSRALARMHYAAALEIDPDFAPAHQGLARLLSELGEPDNDHWRMGYVGHAIQRRGWRGGASRTQLLLLNCARGGNAPVRGWLDERIFDVTVLYVDFHDPAEALPPFQLVLNAIGDGDLCQDALRLADELIQAAPAPLINAPSAVMLTGREAIATRLAHLEGVRTPRMRRGGISALMADESLTFPVLLRSIGFHGGKNFVRVEDRASLKTAAAELAGEDLLAIEYLDARGADGCWRKYRVMMIDGVLYPLHLAISSHWKVHYFSAGMRDNSQHRQEERTFLTDMPLVLGEAAMSALSQIARVLGLDYCGVDFAMGPDGQVLAFEANATMVIAPPDPDPIWDYRREPIERALSAARQMLIRRSGATDAPFAGAVEGP